jgi:hypothetical protein
MKLYPGRRMGILISFKFLFQFQSFRTKEIGVVMLKYVVIIYFLFWASYTRP